MKKKKNKTLRSFSCGFQVFFMEKCAQEVTWSLKAPEQSQESWTEVYSSQMQIAVETVDYFIIQKSVS